MTGIKNGHIQYHFFFPLYESESKKKKKLSLLTQASELQSIDGLSVYDQDKFEAGVLQQVDKALIEISDDDSESVPNVAQPEEGCDGETERERKIRLGEMTPFGTTLPMNATSSRCVSLTVGNVYFNAFGSSF